MIGKIISIYPYLPHFSKISQASVLLIDFIILFREERCYVSGRLDGTAKYFYPSGSVETRIYENGVLEGKPNFIIPNLYFIKINTASTEIENVLIEI